VDQLHVANICASQDGGLVHGRVATADHTDVLAHEKRRVARGAVRDALAEELLFARNAQRAERRARGHNHGPGCQFGAFTAQDAPVAINVNVEADGGVHDELRPRRLGLLLDDGPEVEASDALREPWEVLNLLDVQHLPASRHVLDETGPQPQAGAIHCRREARETTTHDHQVIEIRHRARATLPVAATSYAFAPTRRIDLGLRSPLPVRSHGRPDEICRGGRREGLWSEEASQIRRIELSQVN